MGQVAQPFLGCQGAMVALAVVAQERLPVERETRQIHLRLKEAMVGILMKHLVLLAPGVAVEPAPLAQMALPRELVEMEVMAQHQRFQEVH